MTAKDKTSSIVGREFSFSATLENWAEGMDYCAVRVPADITQQLGTKGPVRVQARVNASDPFSVSLFPVGGGVHYIRIKALVRKQTGSQQGDTINLHFVVVDPADVIIPDVLSDALEAEGLMTGFMALPPGKRNYLIRRVNEAAKAATTQKRVQEAVASAFERYEKTRS